MKLKSSSLFSLALAGVLVLLVPNALRADTFSLTASGGADSINATLTATLSGTPGVYDITGISGIANGESVSLLSTSSPGVATVFCCEVISGSTQEVTYNNLLYTNGAPFFDNDGLAFKLADGTVANLFESLTGGYLYFPDPSAPNFDEPVSVTVARAPENGTLALLLAGMFALGLIEVMARRRRNLFTSEA